MEEGDDLVFLGNIARCRLQGGDRSEEEHRRECRRGAGPGLDA